MKLIGYEWRLREIMAAAGMFSTTKLSPALEERGVYLSKSQVYRLTVEKPERLNMQVLVAILDIFDCTFDELVPRIDLGVAAATGTSDETVGAASDVTQKLRELKLTPRRADIRPNHD